MARGRRSGRLGRGPGRVVAVTTLAMLLAGGVPVLAAAADKVAFTIRDDRITESSALASDTSAQLYWTTNDSGSTRVVYGVSPKGKVQGTLRYRATVTDVEALAVHENRLYVADIGDNTGSRSMVTVYYFLNPRANGLTVTYNAYDFRYPDGAHDAETLLVNGAGRLYIVTKGAEGAIYAAPTKPSRDSVNELEKVGKAPGLVTDGVFLPGGRQIALLTYSSVVVLDAGTYKQVATATIPAQRQAESLAVDLAGTGLLVGSEGTSSKVYAMAVPGAASATANPSATSSATAAASAEAPTDSSDEDVDAAPAGSNRRGTYLAVGLAGLVALVAGVVVALARKP